MLVIDQRARAAGYIRMAVVVCGFVYWWVCCRCCWSSCRECVCGESRVVEGVEKEQVGGGRSICRRRSGLAFASPACRALTMQAIRLQSEGSDCFHLPLSLLYFTVCNHLHLQSGIHAVFRDVLFAFQSHSNMNAIVLRRTPLSSPYRRQRLFTTALP
jgi:hypothetical protein